MLVVGAVGVGVLAAIRAWSGKAAKRAPGVARNAVAKGLRWASKCPATEALEVVTLLRAEIGEILAQVRTNGGSSIKDAIVRMEKRVGVLAEEVRYLRVGHDLQTEATNYPQFRADEKGHTVWVNRAMKLAAGLTDDDQVMGTAWLNHVHKDDRDKVRDNWFLAVAEKREYADEYRIVVPPANRIFYIVALAKPIRVDGVVAGWSGTIKVRGASGELAELE